jgi:hypothetical protein
MASTSMIMTKGDDIGLVILRYTPPNDLIEKILEQVRIVQEKVLQHGQKFGPILSPPLLRQLVGDEIVHYVNKPWYEIMSNVHQVLIRESF